MMKKTFLLLIFFLHSNLWSQVLSFQGCQTAECDETTFKEVMLGVENALYDYYGYKYNDSMYFELRFKGKDLKIEKPFAWVNGLSLSYYIEILKKNIDYERINQDSTYKVIWVTKPEIESSLFPHIDSISEVPVPNRAISFIPKGQKAVYEYYYSAYIDLRLGVDEFKEEFKADLYFDEGKLYAIDYISPPRNQKAHSTAQIMKMVEKEFINLDSLNGSFGKYKMHYEFKPAVELEDADEEMLLLESLKYYQEQGLYRNLRKILRFEYANHEGSIEIDTVGSIENKKVLEFLEQGLNDSLYQTRWWTLKREEFQLKDLNLEKGFRPGDKVPAFEVCQHLKENEERQNCFQYELMNFAAKEFKYPLKARQAKIQGRVYLSFVIEKDGSNRNIRVDRGVHPLLDIEAIRALSKLQRLWPAQVDGKPVRMFFTLPLNVALR